jgi:hypothetical protein
VGREQSASNPSLALPATPIVDGIVDWTSRNRDRAILMGVGAVMLLAALVGLTSADALELPAGSNDPVTTTVATTTVPPTTAPVATVPPAGPSGQQPCQEGCGNGRGGEEKDGRDKKDDD